MRKQGWLFTLGALEWIYSGVRLNGLFDFCNRQEIIFDPHVLYRVVTRLILKTSLNKNSIADIFKWILQNILEYLFYRTSRHNCWWPCKHQAVQWNRLRNLEVAGVVNLKLVFTDLLFYNLVVLIKLCKTRYLN